MSIMNNVCVFLISFKRDREGASFLCSLPKDLQGLGLAQELKFQFRSPMWVARDTGALELSPDVHKQAVTIGNRIRT